MLLSRWFQARAPRKSGRKTYRPQLLALEDRAVPTTVTVHVGPVSNFMAFSPATQTVHVGDTVHWVWDTANHSSTSGTVGHPDGKWDSGVHDTGFTFDHTFGQAGTFPYFCTIHGAEGMVGKIIVAAGAAGGTSSGKPAISISDVQTREGQAGTHVVSFVVKLSHASKTPVTVKFTTANGTAMSGSDFLPASGTLTFKPGQTRASIAVKIKGDMTPEPDEKFSVKLSHPSGATLSKPQATGTILNDDGAVG